MTVVSDTRANVGRPDIYIDLPAGCGSVPIRPFCSSSSSFPHLPGWTQTPMKKLTTDYSLDVVYKSDLSKATSLGFIYFSVFGS